jgi:hypothetical protein
MELSEKALEAKRKYNKEYRDSHKKTLKEYYKTWRQNNSDKIKQYNSAYWEKKAKL